jgi:nitrite reductase/ring-hydroxylating ferredoxin subunit/uncharacterized membrane protein
MWLTALTGKLEQAAGLDPLVDAVSERVNAVLKPGAVKDALHGTWLGHPVHPLLVTMPIGMWLGASVLDLTSGEGARRAARRLVGTGVLAFFPTAAAGWADWSEIGSAMRPKRVGIVHAVTNGTTTAVYLASWLARRRGDQARGRNLALVGSAGLMVGGYLGGHLSYSQAVGVNRNADESKEPTDWTDVGSEAELSVGLHRVEVGDQQVVLIADGGELFAMGATCSHQGGPLDEGSVEDGCIVCPWHGSRFSLRDGSVVGGPATSPQLAYDVLRRAGRIQLKART